MVKYIGCGALNKEIPYFVKQASSKQIQIFLDYFGDKHIRKDGWREFYSSSKKLIDDLQECLIKIGRNGDIRIIDRRGSKSWCNNHWIITKNLQYKISERVKKTDSYIRKQYDMSIMDYEGDVWCAKVPNHIMLVRRNGKACFCGNTLEVLEAMACGVTVVTTPAGIANDICESEHNCLLVPFNNKDILKHQVKRIMEDKELRNRLRKNAWNTVKNMTEQKMAYEYSNLYYEVMNTDFKLMSIIIPTYNRKKQIKIILQNLKEQLFNHFEVIIADDNSDDGTEEMVKEMKEKLPYAIKYINSFKNGYNLGLVRNLATVEAEGEYLVFLDSRLCPESEALLVFYQMLEGIDNDKVWFFGNKGSAKKSFVENFSAVSRKQLIKFGMFNTIVSKYGGMSQEIRTRWIQQGGEFRYVDLAKAKELVSSKQDDQRRKDIIEMKLLLFKLYGSLRH